MLETLDLRTRMAKADYRAAMDRLDARLGVQQRALREAGIPTLVVLHGWDAAGKGEVLARLLQPLDPRGFKVYHPATPTERERMYPPMRRYWLHLPARGQIVFFDHGWYRRVFEERLVEKPDASQLAHAFEQIRVFERQLADDGAAIVKFFLHIDKAEQKRRFKRLLADPAFAWRIGKTELRRHRHYDALFDAAEQMLRETSAPEAPWHLIPATDERHATVSIAETLVAEFDRALNRVKCRAAAVKPAKLTSRSSPLDRVDLTHKLSRESYEKIIPPLQMELRRLQYMCYQQRRPVLVVYEGWDAAGKGGNIRRLVRQLDPRGYEVVPFAAPTEEEKKHHYLWRFWRALPKAGHLTIFDRSYYGRVMVERVEGFATPEEWQRAYREINEFEEQLLESGMVIVKFWLHISKDEQLRRFKARQTDSLKEWKITDEDWRNRKQWNAYHEAVSTMIARTSTPGAPWTIIEGNDKLHARVQALQTVIKSIRQGLKPRSAAKI